MLLLLSVRNFYPDYKRPIRLFVSVQVSKATLTYTASTRSSPLPPLPSPPPVVCQPPAAGSTFTRLLRGKKILSDFCLTGTDSRHAGIQFLRKNKWISAANRFQFLHERLQTTSQKKKKKICSMSVYSDLDAQYPQTITGNSHWHILHLKDQHGCCLFSHCTVSGLTTGSRLHHYLSRTSYVRGWWRSLHIAMATEPAALRHVWAEDSGVEKWKHVRVYMWRNKVCEHLKVGYRQTTTWPDKEL